MKIVPKEIICQSFKIYLTNNISESINQKLNFYLPKRATNNKDFVVSVSNVLNNNNIKKKDIIRHDYITRTMMLMIKSLDIKEEPKWISYDEYYKYLKNVIKKNICLNNEESENNIIKIINELEISVFNNNIVLYTNNNNDSQIDYLIK